MSETFLYDEVPYPSNFFMQTFPDRLATIGTLFGMKPQSVTNCRVFEFGCGDGSNLIAQAFNLPTSEFIGVDLGEKHIASARKSAQELNLKNVTFHQLDVLQMDAEKFGKFDYITAHGFLSWIPPEVQEKTYQLFRQMLTPQGIGYLSFNAYPGCHVRNMTREMMFYATREIAEPVRKAQRGISFLNFLAENSNEIVLKNLLQREVQRHVENAANVIIYDELNELNFPFYFKDFAAQLAENGLQFLAEASLNLMSTQGIGQQAQQFLASLDDIVEREQFLDFFVYRTFRQSLFCNCEIKLKRQIEPSVLDHFYVASAVVPADGKLDLSPQKPQEFKGNKEISFAIDHPLTKAALTHLGEIYGKGIFFPELLHVARQTLKTNGISDEDSEADENAVRSAILQIYCNTDAIELRTYQPEISQTLSEMPQMNDLAHWQIRRAHYILTLYNLSIKLEGDVSPKMLSLLDGTRNLTQLFEEMSQFIKQDAQAAKSPELLDDLLNRLETSLHRFAKLGLFVA